MRSLFSAVVLAFIPLVITRSLTGTVAIDSKLTYLLTPTYTGNLSQNFVDTENLPASTQELFTFARAAPFIVYDPEFSDIIGQNATAILIAEQDTPFAAEAGVWVPDRNEVWFTSSTVNNSNYLMVLDLATSSVTFPQTSIPILNPNGGYYFNGTVYITGTGTLTQAPCIYAINPSTKEASIVLNTYFGLRFNGPNDVTWITRGNKSYMFFTDDPISETYVAGIPLRLPDAVWRFCSEDGTLIPVISRADILIPNGIRVNIEQTKLYVTDSTATDLAPTLQGGAVGTGSPAIFIFDIDDEAFPVNKRMFGISRTGIPDGIHIDDAGRVWTGEYEGVVVRNVNGKVIGLFNSEVFDDDPSEQVRNFALAGDTLVLLEQTRIWTVKLAQQVVAPNASQSQ